MGDWTDRSNNNNLTVNGDTFIQPRPVFIVGAGFSKSIAPAMLTTNELGKLVLGNLRSKGTPIPNDLVTGSFESWLSRLADRQPYTSEDEALMRMSYFLRIANELANTIDELESQSTSEDNWVPPNMERFINLLHASEASVISYNYDTLIEKAVNIIKPLDLSEKEDKIGYLDIVGHLPPVVGTEYNRIRKTFRLLKLHGSVDCWWVPEDISGSTIVRFHYPDEPNPSHSYASSWQSKIAATIEKWPASNESKLTATQLREKFVPGRSRFIVPPTLGKNAFYSNPIMREIWKQAANSIKTADEIHIVGYSLPLADSASFGMLSECIKDEASIYIANICPVEVQRTLENIGLAKKVSNMKVFNSVDSWLDDLESRLEIQAVHKFRWLLTRIPDQCRSSKKLGLAVNWNPRGALAVCDVQREGFTLILSTVPSCEPDSLITMAVHGKNLNKDPDQIENHPVELGNNFNQLDGITKIIAKYNAIEYKIIDVNLSKSLHPGALRPYWLVFNTSSGLVES